MQEYVRDISVTEPISRAWDRMIKICFRPFGMEKWFLLGFCAWLAQLGEAGASNYFQGFRSYFPSPGRPGAAFPSAQEIRQWITDNPWIIPVVIGGFLFFTILGIVMLWVRTRGAFVFLEALAFNRTLVKQPWGEYRKEGNSLFKFYLVLYLLSGVVSLSVFFAAGVLAWPAFQAQEFKAGAVAAILLMIFLWIPLMLVYAFIQGCTDHFVIPILYLQRQGVRAAWGRFRREVLGPHFFTVILYFSMNFLLGIGAGMATMMFGIGTCCLGFFLLALPYVSAVVTLPISVFFRGYGVYFLAQVSEDFKLFSEDFPVGPRGFPMVMSLPGETPPPDVSATRPPDPPPSDGPPPT